MHLKLLGQLIMVTARQSRVHDIPASNAWPGVSGACFLVRCGLNVPWKL